MRVEDKNIYNEKIAKERKAEETFKIVMK